MYLHVHLVFVTKYRRKAMADAMLTRCEEIMREVCADFGAELKQFNGEEEHVHLLVHYPPKVQLSKLVNSLKGVSAPGSLHEEDASRTSGSRVTCRHVPFCGGGP
ncbi:IS200/IS605 family transposase (plasmid) [Streptomyces chartreusis]|nr:IS200/IS605 family transposase [Streptomyces chartreusis]